jgi:hypothetical protein
MEELVRWNFLIIVERYASPFRELCEQIPKESAAEAGNVVKVLGSECRQWTLALAGEWPGSLAEIVEERRQLATRVVLPAPGGPTTQIARRCARSWSSLANSRSRATAWCSRGRVSLAGVGPVFGML